MSWEDNLLLNGTADYAFDIVIHDWVLIGISRVFPDWVSLYLPILILKCSNAQGSTANSAFFHGIIG